MDNLLFYLIPIVFILIVLYVYRPWAKKRYQKDAQIPFAEDKDGSSSSESGEKA